LPEAFTGYLCHSRFLLVHILLDTLARLNTLGDLSMAKDAESRTAYLLQALACCLLFTILARSAVGAEDVRRVQEIQGYLQSGSRLVYTVHALKKGDTLFAYMHSTGGNLDPVLGVAQDVGPAEQTPEELLEMVVTSSQDFLSSYRTIADTRFLAWADDSGSGYDASLEFPVPEDGTYFLFAESMITNQTPNAFQPQLTSGPFRLLLGLNAPEVAKGQGEETGEQPLATITEPFLERRSQIELLVLKASPKNLVTFMALKKLQPGDVITARLTSPSGSELPKLYLTDIGSKPLVFGVPDEPGESILLNYRSRDGGDNLLLYLNASSIDAISEEDEYQLAVGINAPEVLQGEVTARGLPVFQESSHVQIGLSIDQIANVDQQSENFSVVGTLLMTWNEPALAFSPDRCNCGVKKMGIKELQSHAGKHDILLPNFIFFNQQGNRWLQGETVLIEPSGLTTYKERFTVTLQEPGFDFRAYPFDRQQFNIRIDLVMPTEVFEFTGVVQPEKALGDQLGEEEWTVIEHVQKIETVPQTLNHEHSRLTMTLVVTRHLNYYIVRIIIPLLLIITVSWVIFFLYDYGRQLEVASGNLLVFVAFNFTISNDLPRLGYLTLLDRIIITSFCCAALVVLISVCQKRLQTTGRADLASRIDKVVLVSYPLVYLFLIIFEFWRVAVGAGE